MARMLMVIGDVSPLEKYLKEVGEMRSDFMSAVHRCTTHCFVEIQRLTLVNGTVNTTFTAEGDFRGWVENRIMFLTENGQKVTVIGLKPGYLEVYKAKLNGLHLTAEI